MKNNITKSLIGIALMIGAGTVCSEPVEYTFSTTGVISIDPLLTGLTSVSGSFIYENAAAPIITASGNPSTAGSTVYLALSNLSGNADGNVFSDSLGGVVVGDDKFVILGCEGGKESEEIAFGGSGFGVVGIEYGG